MSLIPEHLRKDWLLHFSGFFTWSVVSFVLLNYIPKDIAFFLKATASLLFYMSFVLLISCKQEVKLGRDRLIIALQLLLILALIYFDNNNIAAILLVLVATQLPARFTRKQAMLVMFGAAFIHFLIEYQREFEFVDAFFQVAIFLMLQVFGFSAIESVLRESRAKEELSAINQELLATRFMLKESSQRKERLRISRDLHDVIGHQLTALALNLEVTSHKVPAEFKEQLQQNLAQAKALLADVREVVKEMRHQEQFDLQTKLTDLVAQLPNCQLLVESIPEVKSLSLKQQLMYCLQEGISNAIRHGRANRFILSSQQEAKRLTISLTDNGVSKKTDDAEGTGLLGMKERLIDFNGQVELTHSQHGCCLMIQVEDNYD